MSKCVYIAEIVASNGAIVRVGGVYRSPGEARMAIARLSGRQIPGAGVVRKEQWCEKNVLTTAADGVLYRKGGSDD